MCIRNGKNNLKDKILKYLKNDQRKNNDFFGNILE